MPLRLTCASCSRIIGVRQACLSSITGYQICLACSKKAYFLKL